MSSLTHSERREKHRASLPAAKRRTARTTKMRLIRIEMGIRRKKQQDNAEAKPFRHKARKPGTVRVSRMAGGSGFRNNWEG